MILYASSPDGLAAQQQAYDQLYTSNNQSNANRFDSAQARALQASLSQQDSDQKAQQAADDAAQRAYQFNQGEDFQSQQNALDRASREKDVDTQYTTTSQNRKDVLDQKDFDNAQKLAMIGQTPQTEDALKLQYPNFDENQIKVLANASAQYGFNKFQGALNQSIKNGQPLPIESVKNFVNPNSPIYQDAVDHRSSVLAPYVSAYNSSSAKAEKGNEAARIVADTTAPPLNENVNGATWYNPLSWLAQGAHDIFTPAANQNPIVPVGGWQQRASQVVSALSSGQNPDVTTDPITGKYVSAYPNPNMPTQMQPPTISGGSIPPIMAGRSIQPNIKAPVQPIGSSNVPPVSARVAGQTYGLPNGNFIWTGTGWVRAQ